MNEMLKLAIPLVLTYVGQMTMGLVAIIAVGRVSAEAIGAVGVGVSIFSWFMIAGIGLLSGLDYLISHAYGAGNKEDSAAWFKHGAILSLLMTFPLNGALILISYHLNWFGINPSLLESTGSFLRTLSFSLFPIFLFTACRQYLQALSMAKPAMYILIGANVVNAVAQYVLVLGKWGSPAFGAPGSAWATLIARVLMLFSILLYVWRAEGGKVLLSVWDYSHSKMIALVKLGIPAAIHMLLEVGVFSFSTIFAARLSASDLAAHQVVLNIVSVTFMVPVGISTATAVLVGRAIGQQAVQEARDAGWNGLKLGVSFMLLSCIILLSFPDQILSVYSNDARVIAIGKSILLLGALFQLFDGAQVVATGALRGLADTKTAMFANLAGHWFLGLPMGLYLCFTLSKGVYGLWVGLSMGLIFVALILFWRWWGSVKKLLLRENILA